MVNDKLMEELGKLKNSCIDLIIEEICNVIDDELFESLSRNQIEDMRDIIKEIVDAN